MDQRQGTAGIAMAAGTRGPSQNAGTPHPASTPVTHTATHMVDHSFTLQAIMEMQKTIGALSSQLEAISRQNDRIEARLDKAEAKLGGHMDKLEAKVGERMGKVEESVSDMKRTLFAAGVVLAIAGTVGGFAINKVVDLAIYQLKAKIDASAPADKH